jgi:hypothetical protein
VEHGFIAPISTVPAVSKVKRTLRDVAGLITDSVLKATVLTSVLTSPSVKVSLPALKAGEEAVAGVEVPLVGFIHSLD